MKSPPSDSLEQNTVPISVIIVNWNSGNLLSQCLSHLHRQTVRPRQIWVIDNASTDKSLVLDGVITDAQFIQSERNIGFAAANNRAIEFCNTEFIALLNPDAFPEPEWLENLFKAAQAYPEFAAFGSRQMRAGHNNIIDGVGDVYHFSGLVWRQDYGRRIAQNHENFREIFSPCACAALYRLEAIKAVDGFDQDYFCYVEDVDLGFRLRLAGYKALYVPNAVVYHVGSATTGGSHSEFSVYHGHRNLVWAYIKNMPSLLFWLLLPFHILLNFISVVYFCLLGQSKVIFRAKWDALRELPEIWQKRKLIQQRRIATISGIWRVLDKYPLSSGDGKAPQ